MYMYTREIEGLHSTVLQSSGDLIDRCVCVYVCICIWPLPIGAFQDQCKQAMITKYSNKHN